MDESLIKKITQETIERMKNRRASIKKVLLIVMGGDREVDESLNQVKNIAGTGLELNAYLTKAAQRIIGTEKIRACGISRIISDNELWDRNIIDSIDAVIVPVLTLNGASKIANMVADNPVSNIILLAFRHGKKVIIAKDAIICCGAPEPPAVSAYMRKINEILNMISSYGADVTVAKNLARTVSQVLDLSFPRSPVSQPVSGISGCDKDTSACSECGLCVINRENDVKKIIDAGASRISAKQVNGVIDSQIAPYIDHTSLKADVTQEQIGELCEEARKYSFATVCVNPSNVKFAKQLLSGCNVGVTTVIGFPLGATTPTVKAIEARDAIANGVDEIDMVINVGALKSGNLQLVEDDIRAVREATAGKVLKVILETALLNDEQKVKACEICKRAGADYVKTSTGFGPGGATAEDIRLMRQTVGPLMGVKASGGIRTGEDAQQMIEAGATRIGASASVAIVTGGKSDSNY